jgi:beta-lactamase superfamily II metal-dependent hydrolase
MARRSKRTKGKAPARIRVRMYQVGFGDCFLVSFEYDGKLEDGRSERHVLIDFGSTRLPTRGGDLLPVAQLISEHSAGTIDALVVTHRHKDHLSAFGSKEIAKVLGQPKLVVRSWTEDPKAPEDPRAGAARPARASGRGVASLSFRNGLLAGQAFANSLAKSIASVPLKGIGGELRQMAFDQLSNQDAIDQLNTWAKGGRARYVSFGQPSGIEDIVPGIGVEVLGPPTLEQHPEMAKQRESDKDEFWMLYKKLVGQAHPLELLGGQALGSDGGDLSDEDAPADVEDDELEGARLAAAEKLLPGPAQWLIDKMGRQQVNSFLRIVRILDKALNNTSVVLLFEVESEATVKRLLFPGDAQIENWEYPLKVADGKDQLMDRLGMVDLYKVGHHGSRNATPRTLFNLWGERPTAKHHMTALMSTKSKVHGETLATAVPRATLVKALTDRMDLYSTEGLGRGDLKGQRYIEVLADLSKDAPFKRVPPSKQE